MAVVRETFTAKNGEQYQKHSSDRGCYIQDTAGNRYVTAVDPLGIQREYTETNVQIRREPETINSKIAKLQTQTQKNTADIEYLAMMTDTDLEV